MATRTLKAKYESRDDMINHPRSILCQSKNAKGIHYQFEDVPEAPPPVESHPETVSVAKAPAVVAMPAPSQAATASIEDVPIKAIDILIAVITQKLKKRVDEVPL